MQTTLYHIATGVHGSVYAYRLPDSQAISNDQSLRQGLPGWGVVKVVHAGPSGKTRTSKPHNVLREVLTLNDARHPNIVEVVDYAWSESAWEHQIAMPLLAVSLRTMLDTDILPPTDSELPDLASLSLRPDWKIQSPLNILTIIFRSVAFQLLVALSFLHARGVTHRDVKPENIMLDWDGTVVLTDFGLAWDADAEDWGDEWKEAKGDMCCDIGTGPYRAPELLFSPTTYNPQAIDVWATGCVLAEFFTPLSAASPSPAENYDPLDGSTSAMDMDSSPHQRIGRRSLFDATYGDLGLAGSIFALKGTPDDDTWPGFYNLPDASKVQFTFQPGRPLYERLPGLKNVAPHVDEVEYLLKVLMVLDPGRRIRAEDAPQLPIFKGEDTVVLVPPRLIRSEEYETMEEVPLVDHVNDFSLEYLMGDILRSANHRWSDL